MSEDAKQEAAKTVKPELKAATSKEEKLADASQKSIAQILATNSLANKPLPETKMPVVQNKVIEDEVIELPAQTKFLPQMPAAEKINSSTNFASGDSYAQTGKPSLLNEINKKDVKNIIEEEKQIQKPYVFENTQSSTPGFKITASEIKQTPDFVVKNSSTVPTTTVKQEVKNTENTAVKAVQTSSGYKLTADEIKQTPDVVVKNTPVISATTTKEEVKKVENNLNQIAQNAQGYKLTANEIQKTPDIVIKYDNPVHKGGLPDITKETQYNIEKVKNTADKAEKEVTKQAEKVQEKIQQPVEEIQKTTPKIQQQEKIIKNEVENTKQKVNQVTEIPQVSEIVVNNHTSGITEKYANINPEDFGIQTKQTPVFTAEDDIVELDTNNLLSDMGTDNSFIEKLKQTAQETENDIKTFGATFKNNALKSTVELPEPVLLEEEESIPAANTKPEPVEVPVVVVPKLEMPKTTEKVVQEVKTTDEEITAMIPPSLLQERPIVTDKDIEKKAAEELKRIVPDVVPVEQPEIVTIADEPLTKEKLEEEKARLKKEIEEQKEQLKLAKEKAKYDSKAQKILNKEKAKAQKAQEKWEKEAQKALAQQQKEAQKAEELALQEQAKLQKKQEKLISVAKNEKEQAELELLKIKQQTEKAQSQAQKDALKAQLKAEREQAQKEAKAKKAALKEQKKAAKATANEKESALRNFFSKFKKEK